MLINARMFASLAVLGTCCMSSSNVDAETENMSQLMQSLQNQMQNMRLQYASDIENLQKQQQSMKEQHQRELDSLSAALEQQQDAVDNALGNLDKTQQIQQMRARHLASVGLDDLDSFSGVEIKKNSAMISLGEDADIKILRTDFGKLDVLADEYQIHGTLLVDNIVVNGTNLTDLCNCDGSSFAGQTEFRLQALTGTADYSDTNDDIYVEFLVNHQWSDPYIFFSMTDIDAIEVTGYCVFTCIIDSLLPPTYIK